MEMKKVDIARNIFAEIHLANRDEATETPRQEFIRRMGEEAELSQPGAASYWQMMNYEARGENLYKHHRRSHVGKTVSKNEPVHEINDDDKWAIVGKEDREEIATAPTRDKAKAIKKEMGDDYTVTKR